MMPGRVIIVTLASGRCPLTGEALGSPYIQQLEPSCTSTRTIGPPASPSAGAPITNFLARHRRAGCRDCLEPSVQPGARPVFLEPLPSLRLSGLSEPAPPVTAIVLVDPGLAALRVGGIVLRDSDCRGLVPLPASAQESQPLISADHRR